MISEEKYIKITEIVLVLTQISEIATESNDSFISFSANGSGSLKSYSLLTELLKLTRGTGVEVDLDGSKTLLEQFEDYIRENDYTENWFLTCNKESVFNVAGDSVHCVTFCSEQTLIKWLEHVKPFSPLCPINRFEKIIIFVANYNYIVKTHKLVIQGLNTAAEVPLDHNFPALPSNEVIYNTIHIQSASSLVFLPTNFMPDEGGEENNIVKTLRFYAAQILAVMLSSRFNKNGTEKVEICGEKSVFISLTDKTIPAISYIQIMNLVKLVSWIYEEKTETRLKLIHNRMSFDLNEGTVFVTYCITEAASIFKSGKEQYNYILADLVDAFESSKRKFLSDLKDVAEKYGSKLNLMFSAITRDFLAVVAILVLTVAPKIIVSGAFKSARFLSALTILLTVYILLSGFFQFVLHLYECREMQRVVKLWLANTNVYLNKEEVTEYVDKYTKGPRRKTLTATYIFLFAYCIMGLAVYHSDNYIEHLAVLDQASVKMSKKNNNFDTYHNDNTNLFVQKEVIITQEYSLTTNSSCCTNKISENKNE